MNILHLATALITIVALDALGGAEARIKLVTLPVRDRVEVRLDANGRTLVEEERLVPLAEGRNQVDFAWANTRIAPDSIVFRVLDPTGEPGAGRVQVLSVSYPPGESALVWSVHAARAGAARIRISYLLGGLERAFHYRAVADRDERTLALAQHLRVRNGSNESLGESGIWFDDDAPVHKRIAIDETRDIRVRRHVGVPIRKTYTADLATLGYLDAGEKKLRVALHYVIDNTAEHGLGAHALPAGKARIFQRDGHGGSAFLGEDWGKYTAPGDELRLYLGVARDVVVRRVVEHHERKRIDGAVHGHDLVLRYEIENFKDAAVTLDLVESLAAVAQPLGLASERPPEWSLGRRTTFPGGADADKTRADRLVVHAPLPAAEPGGKARKVVHRLHLRIANVW